MPVKPYQSVFGLILILIVAYACNRQVAPATPQERLANGKRLARQYCVSCHRFPEPYLADKGSWEQGILPAMAKNLGIQSYLGQYFADTHSAIGTSQWLDVVNWYKTLAPDSLVIPKPAVAPLHDWAGFTLIRPRYYDHAALAMTSMITVNPATRRLYTADAGNALYQWDAQLKPKLIGRFTSPVTDINFADSNSAVLTCIGSMMPADVLNGQVLRMNLNEPAVGKPVILTDSLPRPVQTATADFNKDGLPDYLTCGFGHDRGGLYLMLQQTGHRFKKSIVSAIAGATQVTVGDYNHDGWPDAIVLFAQADEGIRMFINNHQGGFTVQTLLRFPSIYGSSSFQLVDMNRDGKPDLLYTCGDNSDYSPVLKPYHGVYIFTNQGNWKFKQQYFYHIDGCTKAMAADFDGDGDMDIAAIAFFSDFKFHPEEGFNYLEQTGGLKFTVHECPVNNYGRWLTMEVADVTQDGRPDVILGNFSIGQRGLLNQKGFIPKWDMHEPIIILARKSGVNNL